ncbi:MAG: anti-sigma factor family protein [Blastocatellia bacterium]
MNCERCQDGLEDFLYGELSEARAAGVRAHLGNCAVCAALRDDIERENEIFTRFYERTSIEPAGEMWEAIRARINAEPQVQAQIERETGWLERLRAGALGRRGFEWLLAPTMLRQVAFASLLVALSVAATTIYLKRGGDGAKDIAIKEPKATPTPAPQQPTTPIPAPSTGIASDKGKSNNHTPAPKSARPIGDRAAPARPLTDQELMNRQIARAAGEYQKAIRMLDRAIAKQRDSLDPGLIKQYESSLALIDSSIAASRRALRERPDDPTAGQFLLAAYAKKLDLMQDIAMK